MTNKKEKLKDKFSIFSKKVPTKQNKDPRSSFTIFIVISLIFASLFTIFGDEFADNSKEPTEVAINEMQAQYKAGELKEIKIERNRVLAESNSGSLTFSYRIPNETSKDMGFQSDTINTKIIIQDVESGIFWKDLVLSIIPIIIIFMIISFVLRQSTKGLGGGFGFGKSKAKMFDKENVKTKFTDIAGSEESKNELIEVVDFLKNPKKYKDIGAKIPKGVLMVGAPGTGKTLLSRAVAGEAGVPFFGISGSEFVEMFVGVGASRVRDLFTKAKESAPCIIFIDEIDAIGKQRGGIATGGGHDEREQTLNQILTEMDGFEPHQNVIVLAATNRPEVLDKALLRPGRFDRQVVIEKPDQKERIAILEVHGKTRKMVKGINLKEVARKTPGFTGADLANVINEAAILAARDKKKELEQKDIMEAVEKVMMGPERKSSVLTESEKEITAYHEIGHALVSHYMPDGDPIHKISIIARGRSLGSTWYLPKEETKLYTETKFFAELSSLYGGYVAEKIIFGEVSTGASNDIERATHIARNMVTQYGMSDLGPIQWEQKNSGAYSGAEGNFAKNHSDELARKIDEQVMKILNKAFKNTEGVLTKYKNKLEKLSKVLFEKETILEKEFVELMKND